MKLLNYTTSYLAVVMLLLIAVWAAVFYVAMLDEIYDSIDDGLENQKSLILQKLAKDTTILARQQFDEGDYAIQPIQKADALHFREQYLDTLIYLQNEDEHAPVRLLKTVFQHNGQYYQMQVITSMVEEDDLVSELLYALLWLYGGLLVTVLLVNNFLLKKIWKPFYHLLQQIKNFRLEKQSNIAVQPTKIEEFSQLQQSVQQLLQNNINTFISQKHFIENAAHELQTPLAISINKLEALAESAPLTGQQMALLESALQNLQRLTRLNKSLLLLSRIENRQYGSTETINLNALVKKTLEDWAEQLQFYGIQWQLTEEANLQVQMNADLAVIMVSNLVKNSIVHNHRHGTLHIHLRSNALEIENTGGASALAEQALFTRFSSAATAGASTGLGLAIVKAIADLYRYRVHYRYQQTHIFTISF